MYIENLALAARFAPGVIYACGPQKALPPHVAAAYQNGFAKAPETRRRKKPWLELAARPPGMSPEALARLHRAQMHGAVGKLLGKRGGGVFCAALEIDLYGAGGTHAPTPHLVMATTAFRAPPFRWEDRIDVAVMPCTAEFLDYYHEPVAREVAYWAVNTYARHAPYRVVIDKFGGEEQSYTWGVMRGWQS